MEGGEAAYYGDMARRLVKALSDRCAVRSHEESNGLLLHGTYARASAGNPCANRGVDECNTWGDYFYMENGMHFPNESKTGKCIPEFALKVGCGFRLRV